MLATIAYTRVGGLSEDIRLMNADRYPKTVLAHKIKDELNETARNMRNILLMTDADEIKKELANIDEASRIITESIDKLDKSITTLKR
ncbi:MCP four helix bundle domain-containing protein [Undibacterium arcticum]